ncbi:MAG: hypothetical protein M1825_003496 [Sarcosagium campestre]|nr:MAG: hypothetical protein M1825_003496 [Sarcosagium campestre]
MTTSDLSNDRLRVLLIGKGGREHALAWKLSQSSRVEEIFVVPGNGGTQAGLPNVSNIIDVAENDYPGLVVLAQRLKVNLVVPAPDLAVVDGIEGFFRDAGIACFGPSKESAQLEGSKAFSKDFMKRNGIPTAQFEHFDDYETAKRYLEKVGHDVVIKASGLAAGKGVVIPSSKDEALKELKEIMVDLKFGDAGKEIVIEEFLEGVELSIHTFSDGVNFKSLPAAQDHKRVFDGDEGPNTGGMGCYAPVTSLASPEILQYIDQDILGPTFSALRREDIPFVGMLFTGIMLTSSGPKVLEYNVRFGDPETQTLLPLLATDLASIMVACVRQSLDAIDFKIQPGYCATVIVASGGYPGTFKKGVKIILSPRSAPGTEIFHAGTQLDGKDLKTSGGRVLAVSATAEDIQSAVHKAYEGVKAIQFDGMFFRKDIAHQYGTHHFY